MRSLALLLLFASTAAAGDFPTWMTGSWAATIDGVKMEEQWTDSGGGVMLGLHRDIRPNGKVFFEFLRMERRDGRLAYVAQPGGRPATVFPLKTIGDQRVVFENLGHDFPQRIIYWLEGAALCARVEGGEQSQQWCWSRVTR
ncbi:MAG TPA: DUF6265 family protein [Thermoanaerobaculia bacterium]|nr:DUF6265 family protein [Thermoanaerobaculia bacterium]